MEKYQDDFCPDAKEISRKIRYATQAEIGSVPKREGDSRINNSDLLASGYPPFDS
jgi:hypothetical protein